MRYLYASPFLFDWHPFLIFDHFDSGTDSIRSFPPLSLSRLSTDGMNLAIGPLSYKQDDQSFQKPFSEKTAELLDFEVRKMVQGAHKRTTELLMEKREEVIKVAELLLAKEVLSRFVPSFICRFFILIAFADQIVDGHWSILQGGHDCSDRSSSSRYR